MTTSGHGAPDDVQVLVDELAAELGRSVVINDPLVRLIYASRHYADEDPVRIRAVLQREAGPEVAEYVLGLGVARWTEPGTVPANAELELKTRLCVPLRDRRNLIGLLMVIDADGTLTREERHRIEMTSRGIESRLVARAETAVTRDPERSRALQGLLGAEHDRREPGHRALVSAGVPDLQHGVVTVVESFAARPAFENDAAFRAVLSPYETSSRVPAVVGWSGRRGHLLQLWHRRPSSQELSATGHGLASAAARAFGDRQQVFVGVGAPAPGMSGSWRSARQAELAARAARLVPRFGGVTLWPEAADYAVLLRLPDESLTDDLVPEALQTLIAHEAGTRLRQTLEVYLDQAGSVPRTAELLHLHRTSLYYRLRQISDITGFDLDDGSHRLVLHQGLRALDLIDGDTGRVRHTEDHVR